MAYLHGLRNMEVIYSRTNQTYNFVLTNTSGVPFLVGPTIPSQCYLECYEQQTDIHLEVKVFTSVGCGLEIPGMHLAGNSKHCNVKITPNLVIFQRP